MGKRQKGMKPRLLLASSPGHAVGKADWIFIFQPDSVCTVCTLSVLRLVLLSNSATVSGKTLSVAGANGRVAWGTIGQGLNEWRLALQDTCVNLEALQLLVS